MHKSEAFVPNSGGKGEALWPGLTAETEIFDQRFTEVIKRWMVFRYKQRQSCLWVLLAGGTGTGKSSLFNALCRVPLSQTGIERPKTCGPIAYVHERVALEEGFPFSEIILTRETLEAFADQGDSGRPGEIIIGEHQDPALAHIVLIDTPDLDSLEGSHRQIAQDLYLFSDVVVFVTSQEKYADGIPYAFFQQIYEDNKAYFFILNKAGGEMTVMDIAAAFKDHQFTFQEDRFWLLPYLSGDRDLMAAFPEDPQFTSFAETFFRFLSVENSSNLLKSEQRNMARILHQRLVELLEMIRKENQAAEKWQKDLAGLYRAARENLLNTQQDRFSSQSRAYLQTQIREVFRKYDLLGRPRRALFKMIATYLPLSGRKRMKQGTASHEKNFLKLKKKTDLSPLQAALDQFNRQVLERLSPVDERSALFQLLRQSDIVMTEQEMKKRVWEEQEKMLLWLEQTFEKLTQGIPKAKEWGIYSTSIFWGVFILSIEAAIGGGIGFVDAALDSFLAPLVTKGAMELFAYRELQKIARELTQRYQESLLSVLEAQHKRYDQGLQALIIPEKAIGELEEKKKTIAELIKG